MKFMLLFLQCLAATGPTLGRVVVGPHNKDFPVRPGSRQVTVNVRVLEGSIEPGEHLIVHFSTKDKTAKGGIDYIAVDKNITLNGTQQTVPVIITILKTEHKQEKILSVQLGKTEDITGIEYEIEPEPDPAPFSNFFKVALTTGDKALIAVSVVLLVLFVCVSTCIKGSCNKSNYERIK